VGSGKAVTLASDGSGVLGGADAGNYVLDTSGLSAVTADVSAATLVVGGAFTASDNVYDATTVAQIDAGGLTLAGVLGDDAVLVVETGAQGRFADKNVGSGKAVTLASDGSGVLGGADAGNRSAERRVRKEGREQGRAETMAKNGRLTAGG